MLDLISQLTTIKCYCTTPGYQSQILNKKKVNRIDKNIGIGDCHLVRNGIAYRYGEKRFNLLSNTKSHKFAFF